MRWGEELVRELERERRLEFASVDSHSLLIPSMAEVGRPVSKHRSEGRRRRRSLPRGVDFATDPSG